ncbi:unnamed protein product, partial [Rotaria magnacalcarata]
IDIELEMIALVVYLYVIHMDASISKLNERPAFTFNFSSDYDMFKFDVFTLI